MLGDRGLLTRRNGAVQIAADAEIPVPEGVQAVIAARLDTLAPERKALVHDAAVVGKVFWAGALASMGAVPKESVLAGLHELGRKELVRRTRTSSIGEDVEYLFWHVLVRDVAYAQIPRSARGQKHVAAAEWIERIGGERVRDHAEFLAHHYRTALELARAAGDEERAAALVDRALEFGVLAAERALRLDQSHGERYYRETLALLPESDPRRPRLLADTADAGTHSGTAPFEQIKAEFEEAISGLRAQGDPVGAANAMRQLSYAMWVHGESADARFALADEARRLLENEPEGPELALAYHRLSHEHGLANRSKEAVDWGGRATSMLEHFGRKDDAMRNRSGDAAERALLGEISMAEAREVQRDVLDPKHQLGTYVAVVAYNNLRWLEFDLGRGPRAGVEAGRAAVELGTRRGLERPAAWNKACLARPLFELGEWEEVLVITDDVARWEAERGRSIVGVLASPSAAKVLSARGEAAAAKATLAELLPRAREVQDPHALLPALIAAAVVEQEHGELAAAVSLAEEFLEARRVPNWMQTELSRIALAAGDPKLAERLIGSGGPAGSRFAVMALANRAACSESNGSQEEAVELYGDALVGFRDLGCVVEQAYALLGLGRCRLALGQEAEAVPALQEALEIFRKLGASVPATEVEALLPTGAGRV